LQFDPHLSDQNISATSFHTIIPVIFLVLVVLIKQVKIVFSGCL